MEIITSRLKLISLHPFKDYTGVVHSGDALFLVEPVGKILVAFLPDSEDVLRLVGRENSYVDVVIDLQYFELARPAREKKFLLEEEQQERYRIIGRFRKVKGDCGVFECGNLRFEECFSEESEWIEILGARFYAYLPESD